METFYSLVRFLHVGAGFVGLFAFWIPVFARKGATNHVRFGKVFVWSAYVVLGAAAVALNLGLINSPEYRSPQGAAYYSFLVFLGYLTLATFVIVRHGMAVLQFKPNPRDMRTFANRFWPTASIAASIAIILYGLIESPPNKILLFALSPIGLTTGWGILKFLSADQLSRRAWWYEHMGALLGSGIAFHTAFAVFGITRLIDFQLSGTLAVIPWIAPTLIGVPGIFIWTRYYQRKFKDTVSPTADEATS